jgi:hypothetical protein
MWEVSSSLRARQETSLARLSHSSASRSISPLFVIQVEYMRGEGRGEREEQEPPEHQPEQLLLSESDQRATGGGGQKEDTGAASGSPVTGPIAAKPQDSPSGACSSAHNHAHKQQKQASTAAFATTSTTSIAALRNAPRPEEERETRGGVSSLIGRLGPSTILQLQPGKGSMLSSRSLISEQQASRSGAPSAEGASMNPSHHGQLYGMIPQHPAINPGPAYPLSISTVPLPFLPPSNFISNVPQMSGAHSQQSRPQGLPTSSSAQALADNSFLSNLQAIKTSMPGKKKHSISFIDPAAAPSNVKAAPVPAAAQTGPSQPGPPSISITNNPAATVTNVRTNEAVATTALSPLSLLFASTPTAAETAALAECLAYSPMPNTARAVVKEEGAGIFPPMPNESSSPFPLDLLRPHHCHSSDEFQQPPPMPSCSTAVRVVEGGKQAVAHPAISACAAPAPLPSASRSSDQNLPQASVEVSFVDPPVLVATTAAPALSSQPTQSGREVADEEDLNCKESLELDNTMAMTPPSKRPLSQEDLERDALSLPLRKKVKAADAGEVFTMGESEGGSKKKRRQEDGATNFL